MKETKIGRWLFKKISLLSIGVARKRWLFYLLSYTWGILTTLAGWAMYLFVLIFRRKSIVEKGKFQTAHYLVFGNNWGGLEAGTNFLAADKMGKDYLTHTKCHELGHTYQNAVQGPIAIFLIFIPSVIRYWVQEIRSRKGKQNMPYDSIWFEKSASFIGEQLLTETTGICYFYYENDAKTVNKDYLKEWGKDWKDEYF